MFRITPLRSLSPTFNCSAASSLATCSPYRSRRIAPISAAAHDARGRNACLLQPRAPSTIDQWTLLSVKTLDCAGACPSVPSMHIGGTKRNTGHKLQFSLINYYYRHRLARTRTAPCPVLKLTHKRGTAVGRRKEQLNNNRPITWREYG